MSSVGDKPIIADIPHVNPQCWDGCVEDLANNFKTNNLTTEKVAQKACLIFVLLSTCIFVSALMVQYPSAARTFFTLLGLGAVASLATMVAAISRYCKENNVQSKDLTDLGNQIVEEFSKQSEAPPKEESKDDN